MTDQPTPQPPSGSGERPDRPSRSGDRPERDRPERERPSRGEHPDNTLPGEGEEVPDQTLPPTTPPAQPKKS